MITVEQAKEKMDGVVVPLATLFKDDPDKSLDIDAMQKHAQWIVDNGAKPGNTVFIAVGSGGDFTVSAISLVYLRRAGNVLIFM